MRIIAGEMATNLFYKNILVIYDQEACDGALEPTCSDRDVFYGRMTDIVLEGHALAAERLW